MQILLRSAIFLRSYYLYDIFIYFICLESTIEYWYWNGALKFYLSLGTLDSVLLEITSGGDYSSKVDFLLIVADDFTFVNVAKFDRTKVLGLETSLH
jgi:hypothetical protein